MTPHRLTNKIQGDKTIAKRRGEIFRRIKTKTLANLLREEKNTESVYNINAGDGYPDNMQDNQSIYSLQSHKTQITQVSAVTYNTEQLGVTVIFNSFVQSAYFCI